MTNKKLNKDYSAKISFRHTELFSSPKIGLVVAYQNIFISDIKQSISSINNIEGNVC